MSEENSKLDAAVNKYLADYSKAREVFMLGKDPRIMNAIIDIVFKGIDEGTILPS